MTLISMTERLEQAIAQLKTLDADKQDTIAIVFIPMKTNKKVMFFSIFYISGLPAGEVP